MLKPRIQIVYEPGSVSGSLCCHTGPIETNLLNQNQHLHELTQRRLGQDVPERELDSF